MCLAFTLAFASGSAAVATFITDHPTWALGLFLVFCVSSLIIGSAYRETHTTSQPRYKLELQPAFPCKTPSLGLGAHLLVTISGTVSYLDNGKARSTDACYTWRWNTHPGAFTRHTWLHFDDHDTAPIPFREERHLHRYDFYYEGRGKPLVIHLNLPNALNLQRSLAISIAPLSAEDETLLSRAEAAKAQEAEEQRRRQHEAEEAERRRQSEEAEARRHREAERRETNRRNRFRMIQARYGE